jgi:hypothetical protein
MQAEIAVKFYSYPNWTPGYRYRPNELELGWLWFAIVIRAFAGNSEYVLVNMDDV